MEQLSTGVINKLMNGELVNSPIYLQFVGSKMVNDKYRLFLSDGEMSTSYAFAQKCDMEILRNGTLTDYALCKFTNFGLKKTNKGALTVIVIKNIEVLTAGGEIGSLLGKPISYEPKAAPIRKESPENENPVPPILHNETTTNGINPNQQIFTIPIMQLSPYFGKWTIRARVSAKTDIRHWNNAKSQGRLFSLDLIDESGEIRCTGFNEEVDKFYDLFEVGSIYYISKCSVKTANKRYTTIKHEFELTLTRQTELLRDVAVDLSIPMRQYDFCAISEIEFRESGTAIDVFAIAKSVGEAVKFKSRRTRADLVKREIFLVDDSNAMISLTLWGGQAEVFNVEEGTVLAVKTVTVSDFNGGKSLSSVQGTIIQANPSIPQIESLQAWFHETEGAKNAKCLSNISSLNTNLPWLNFLQVQEQNIGAPGTISTFLTKATIGSFNYQNALYKACPADGCKKKLLDPVNGMYRCVKCNADFPNFVYRMLVRATLLDYTQELKVTIFQNEAEQILNKSSQELADIFENLTTDVYEDVFESCKFKSFIFKILMKQDHFNNITRTNAVVLNATPVVQAEYGLHLLNEIKKNINNPSA